MSFKSVVALFIMAFVMVCIPAFAQENASSEEQTFRLLRNSGQADLDLEISDEENEAWEPAIVSGTIEVSFAMGSLGLNSTLLEHDQIIYKYTDKLTYWGDMAIKGQSAFKPMMRLGYSLTPWLCLEATGAFSFSEYTSTLENRRIRSNEPGSPVNFNPPALGDYDLESRSLLTTHAGMNATVYFLNLDGDGAGRFQPYATGGIGGIWYSINSNYTDEPASSTDYNIGGGFRLLADKNISIRMEALFHANTMEFTPSQFFTSLDEETVRVPLDEFPVVDEVMDQRPVESFSSNSFRSLEISIGLQGSF